jgi:hypothetical protein
MSSRKRSLGRALAGGNITLTTEQSARRARRWLLILLILSAVVGAVILQISMQRMSDVRIAMLVENNEALQEELQGTQADLERALLDLELSTVTRTELERQLIVLTEQHKQLREEFEFVKTAAGRPRGN